MKPRDPAARKAGSGPLDDARLFAAIDCASRALLIVLGPRGEIVRFNHGCEVASGYRAPEVLGKVFWEFLIPEDAREEIRREFVRLRDRGFTQHEYENDWLAKDGSRKSIAWSNTVLFSESGAVEFVVATGIDRTFRKIAERAVRQSRERYESLVHSVDGIVWEADAATFRFSYVSPQAERMLGYPVEQWLSEPDFWRNHIHGPDRERAIDLCARAARERASHDFEYRMVKADGGLIWLHDLVTVISERGRARFLRGIMVDVTRAKHAEEQARKLQLRFKRLFDSNIIGVLIPDLSGGVHEANDAFLRCLGFDREDLEAGRIRWDRLTPIEYRAQDERTVETLRRTGQVAPFEKEYFRKDGTRVPVLIGGAMLDEQTAVAFVLDISERKRLENERMRLLEEAREAVRLRNEFIGIASHELRTPLTPLRLQISAILDLLRTGNLGRIPSTDLTRLCDIAESQLNRLARLVNNLLDVSRITSGRLQLSPESVDLAELLRGVTERFQPEIASSGSSVELRIDARPVGWWDRLRVEQVVINLLSNALKYGGGKPVTLALDERGGEAILSVTDRGIGISAEAQEKIFRRFERAVPQRAFSGMGLGLFITRQIVDAHGGRIEVRSVPGQGATFVVRLPREGKARLAG